MRHRSRGSSGRALRGRPSLALFTVRNSTGLLKKSALSESDYESGSEAPRSPKYGSLGAHSGSSGHRGVFQQVSDSDLAFGPAGVRTLARPSYTKIALSERLPDGS